MSSLSFEQLGTAIKTTFWTDKMRVGFIYGYSKLKAILLAGCLKFFLKCLNVHFATNIHQVAYLYTSEQIVHIFIFLAI